MGMVSHRFFTNLLAALTEKLWRIFYKREAVLTQSKGALFNFTMAISSYGEDLLKERASSAQKLYW